METTELPIIGYFDIQRYPQYCPADTANWYLLPQDEGKKKVAMYPTMGRKHINYLGVNREQYRAEPRGLFKSINYKYTVVLNQIFRQDQFFNEIEITSGQFPSLEGDVWFTFLVVGGLTSALGGLTFAVFTDGRQIFVYREDTGIFYPVTDPIVFGSGIFPTYLASFGSRIVVSMANSAQFFLSDINLDGSNFNPAFCFNQNGGMSGGGAVFAQEIDVIRQFAVLHNTLYIFTSYTTGIWQNTPAVFDSGLSFPFKKNTSFDFNFGLSDPKSLSVSFGMIVWEARSKDGLVQFMVSSGEQPRRISTKAVDILLQNNSTIVSNNPFTFTFTEGFLYSYDNTIFYRVSLGIYTNSKLLDPVENAFSIEYNFDSGQWNRCIEVNGERNRIQKHVFFGNRHFVSVFGEKTVYEMSGIVYTNELRNPDQPDGTASDAYIQYPFRYERVTPIIHEDDYSEFIDDYVEIDFVWGYKDFIKSDGPFENTNFIVAESSTPTVPVYIVSENSIPNDETFLISENGNTPQLNEQIYNTLLKPNITLFISNDGGISYFTADNREFSPLGVNQWRMRWYQLGPSRNRVYKLICVSPAPIIVLGGVRMTRRASGGAN